MSSDLTLTPEYPLGPPLIGALVRMPANAVVARILADLHEVDYTGLVPAHLAVLSTGTRRTAVASELAAEAGMTKQAMNYLLGQMQQLGYLTPATTTRRTSASSASPHQRGHAAARAIRKASPGIEDHLEKQLGPAEFARLRELHLVQLNNTGFVRDFHQRPPVAGRRPRAGAS